MLLIFAGVTISALEHIIYLVRIPHHDSGIGVIKKRVTGRT